MSQDDTNDPEKFSYLPKNKISRQELKYFPEIAGATKQKKEHFLHLRNSILKAWSKNNRKQLTVSKFIENGKHGAVDKFLAKTNKNVVIVGAGISGVVAARQLKNFGINITVLEGRERIGGRMALFKKHPYVADLGAMVVTGSIGNPVGTLLEQAELDVVKIVDACHLYDFTGESVSQQKDELIEKEFNRLLEACAYLAHNVDLDQHRPDNPFSLGETMEIIIQMQEKLIRDKQLCHYKTLCNIQDRMISVLHKINRRKADIIRLHDEYERARAVEAPADPENNAVHDFTLKYKRYQLEEAWRLFDEIMRYLGALEATLNQQEQMQPSDVYLNQKDRRMLDWHFANLEFANAATLELLSLKNWDQDDAFEFGGFHSTVPKGYANLPIILAEGLNIECGAVVKEIKIQQDGCQVKYANEAKRNLKTLKADAVLCTVPLGVLKKCVDRKESEEKAFINFDPPLPMSKIDAINRLGFGNLNKVVLCFDRVFWDPSRHMFGYVNEKTEARGEFFLFWTIYKEPTVTALVAGKSSSKIEYLSEDIVVERCLNVLRTIFSQDQVPPPKETMVTRWANDPFSYGSYSFVAVGASGQDYDILAQSLPEKGGHPRLFFAGEHTCRRYPATVHGAVISALQQAGSIANELLGPCF